MVAQEMPIFRAGVTLVRVDVQVTATEKPISNLSRDDFVLLDEGEPQRIAYFGRETEPLWVLLLLDVSGSMGRFLRQIATVSQRALSGLNPGDHVGVMLFSRATAVPQRFTTDFVKASEAVADAVFIRGLGTATRLNAAVIDAAHYLRAAAADAPGRRALIVLTDNGGMNYRLPNEAVIRALYDANAVLNAIVIGEASPPPRPPRGPDVNADFTRSDVFALARATGGEIIQGRHADSAFRALIEHIRTRYSLHYYSPGGAPGAFRHIRVELSPAARKRYGPVKIKARGGYYVPQVQ